jgi:hypothetical protein
MSPLTAPFAVPASRRSVLLGALLLAACGGGGDTVAPDAASADAPAAQSTGPTMKRLAIAAPAAGTWSGVIPLGMVTPSAALLPNGKVAMWASSDRFTDTAPSGKTYTTLFDPATLTATETLVSNTGHDMFCTGTTNLPDGRILTNGGKDSAKTTIYDPVTNAWTTGPLMTIPRGYNANTLTQDGSVFTLGGSWSGGRGNKHGERWTAALPRVQDVDRLLDTLRGRAAGVDRHTAQAFVFDRQARLVFRSEDMVAPSDLVRLLQRLNARG